MGYYDKKMETTGCKLLYAKNMQNWLTPYTEEFLLIICKTELIILLSFKMLGWMKWMCKL